MLSSYKAPIAKCLTPNPAGRTLPSAAFFAQQAQQVTPLPISMLV